jgi:hypothetical protein
MAWTTFLHVATYTLTCESFSFLIWIVSTIVFYTTILYSISMIWGVGDLFCAIDLDLDVHVSLRHGHKIGTGQIISMGTTLDSGSLIR